MFNTPVLRRRGLFAAPTISHTQIHPRDLLRQRTSSRTEVRMLLHVPSLLNPLLGGWSADGITLPGALDIECLL